MSHTLLSISIPFFLYFLYVFSILFVSEYIEVMYKIRVVIKEVGPILQVVVRVKRINIRGR